MAGAGGIRAGRAYVQVGADDGPLRKTLAATEARLSAFGKGVQATGLRMQGIGLGIAAFGAAASAPFLAAIRTAGDMAETQSKLDATFKSSADAVREWAAAYSKSVGRSEKQILDFSANTGAVLRGFGFDDGEAAEMSKTLSGLAVDLGSFFNLSDEDAMAALISGITGESEPLKKFGLIVQDTQTKAELLAQGIDPSNASDQAKVMARLSLILKGTTDAQGDAIRTASSFNNQMKALHGTVTDVAVAVGNALLPVVTPLVASLKSVVAPMSAWVKENGMLVAGAGIAAAGVTAFGLAVAGLGTVLIPIGGLISAIGVGIGVLAPPIGLTIVGLGLAGAAFLAFADTGKAALGGLTEIATTTFGGIMSALASGDIEKAGLVMWAGLKVLWLQGTEALAAIWADWGVAFQSVASDVSFGFASIMTDMWAGIQATWLTSLGFLEDHFSGFIMALKKGWNSFAGFFAGVWEQIKAQFTGGDAQKEIDRINADVAAKNAKVDSGDGMGSEARREQINQVEADRQLAQQALIDQSDAANTARQDGASQALMNARAELDAAKAELATLTGGGEASTADLAASSGLLGGVTGGFAALLAADAAGGGAGSLKSPGTTGGLGESVQASERKLEVSGGFDAASLAGLGIGSTIESEAPKQTKLLESIDGRLRRGAVPVFTS